jgi:hypothetical protein
MNCSRAKPWVWLSVGFLGLSFLSGCSTLAVWMGLRVRLDKVQVASVAAHLVSTRNVNQAVAALGPGEGARLIIVATDAAGKTYVTVGAGGGKVAFDNYAITTEVAQIKGSKVSLSSDPRVSEGKIAKLHIAPVAHPEVTTDLDIPVHYDLAYKVDFSGAPGANGFDGTPGADGTAGFDAPQTVDPTTGATSYQGPGGSGSEGGNGGDGDNGQDGSPGGRVQVWMRLANADHPLLQVKVVSGPKQSLFLIDPSGGSLRILADGGPGGRGGSGGRGGQGGSGGAGSPAGFSGSDGRRGFDGHAGQGGPAGTIAIAVDPAAQPYLKLLTWSNRSGDGVPGPSPDITIEPLASLW